MAKSDPARAPDDNRLHDLLGRSGVLVLVDPNGDGFVVRDRIGAAVRGPQGSPLVLRAVVSDGRTGLVVHFEERETVSGAWMVMTMRGYRIRVFQSPRNSSVTAEEEARAYVGDLVDEMGDGFSAQIETPAEMERRMSTTGLLPSSGKHGRQRSAANANRRTRRVKGGTH
jgi:hypothetical protein